MDMVIRQIKCSACKAIFNSFYAVSGKCPSCGFIFASAKQVISNTGLRKLKKEKKEYLKNTMTKGQAKRMFKLSEK